jgi:hypothetical protein
MAMHKIIALRAEIPRSKLTDSRRRGYRKVPDHGPLAAVSAALSVLAGYVFPHAEIPTVSLPSRIAAMVSC